MFEITVKNTTLLFLLFCVTGCALKATTSMSPTKLDNTEVPGALLLYSETDSSNNESSVRMLVTKDILRIDAGPGGNYTLYDRIQKTLFKVSVNDRSVQVIKSSDVALQPDFSLNWETESQTSHAVMRDSANGSADATHHQFILNKKACYDIVTINGVFEDVLTAVQEYYLALANIRKQNYVMSENQQCKDAIEIFSPLNHMQYGFPIREWSSYGFQRFLVDYRQHIIFPSTLFSLPDGFSQIIQP